MEFQESGHWSMWLQIGELTARLGGHPSAAGKKLKTWQCNPSQIGQFQFDNSDFLFLHVRNWTPAKA